MADFSKTTLTPASGDKILTVSASGVEGHETLSSIADYIKAHESTGTWASLKAQVDNNTFKDAHAVGEAIVSTYTVNGTTYEYPFIVADNDRTVETAEGTKTHRVALHPMYLAPASRQFSQYRAFLRCPSGLSAGTYYVTFAQTWSALTALNWQFTLTKDVPVGGRIAGFRNFADGQSDTNIYVYGSNGKDLLETTTCSAGTTGTSLGTMNYYTRNGNLNGIQEVFYGYNEYEVVSISQWCDGVDTNWYAPKDDWDCAPDNVSGMGFLGCLDPELVSVLETVKVTTAHNAVQGQSGYTTGYHRAFLPCLEEMYISPQLSGEGTVLPYWKTRSGGTSPQGLWTTNANYKMYRADSKTTAQYYWLRSAHRSLSCFAWLVNSSGYIGNYYARGAYAVAPLVII